MNKRTKLNLFWFLLIIIGVSLGLASFYQSARIEHTKSLATEGFKASKATNQESNTTSAGNQEEITTSKLASKPGVGALGKVFPKLAGFGKEKTFLVLFQNSHELRATGGYIGSFAVVTVKRGRVQEFRFHDTSNFDYQNNTKGGLKKTPQPFQEYLDIHWWGLRDANWYPHFPTTAKKVINFYNELGGELEIDGVVALTPNVLKRALRITGPIKIEGESTFRAENVVDRIQHRVEKGFLEKEGTRERRKEIMKKLAEKIIAKTKSWNPLSYPELLSAVREAAVKKEIQVYFKDQNLQDFFAEQGWTGELKSTSGDFLMVVDTNLGALKTDRVIERELSYEVNLSNSENNPRARLELTYTNTATTEDWRTTDYKSYLRVHLPRGTKLTGTKGLSSKAKEWSQSGKTIYEGLVEVPLGNKKSVVFEYQLPKRINKNNYKLTLQKQAGIDGIPVEIMYRLPDRNLQKKFNLSEDFQLSF